MQSARFAAGVSQWRPRNRVGQASGLPSRLAGGLSYTDPAKSLLAIFRRQ
jgi:hypothetical protein